MDARTHHAVQAVGGVFSASALYPLEIIKNRLQSLEKNGGCDNDSKDGKVEDIEATQGGVAKYIYKTNGFAGFYRGVTVSAVQSAIEKFLYYYAYSFINTAYERVSGRRVGPIANLIIGYASEASHLPISVPVESVMVKLQTSDDSSISEILHKIVYRDGLSSVYKGIGACKLCSSSRPLHGG